MKLNNVTDNGPKKLASTKNKDGRAATDIAKQKDKELEKMEKDREADLKTENT